MIIVDIDQRIEPPLSSKFDRKLRVFPYSFKFRTEKGGICGLITPKSNFVLFNKSPKAIQKRPLISICIAIAYYRSNKRAVNAASLC